MATLVVLMAISVIPPIEAGGISLRRANILSDLIRFDSDKAPAAEPAQPEIDVEDFHVDMEEVERQVARVAQEASPTGPRLRGRGYSTSSPSRPTPPSSTLLPQTLSRHTGVPSPRQTSRPCCPPIRS